MSKDHLPSLQDGRPYLQTSYYSQNSGQEHHGNQNMFLILLVAVVAIILLLRFLCYDCRPDAEEQKMAGVGGDTLESNEAGGGWVDSRAPASTVAGADVEMAPPVRTADEPPLGGGRARAGCAWRTWRRARPSGCCPRACTTSTPPASASGCARTPPARSAAHRSSLPPTPPPRGLWYRGGNQLIACMLPGYSSTLFLLE